MSDKLFAKRVSEMILFLERIVNSSSDFYVEDPIELGEDFIKMGAYLLRADVTEEEFVSFCEEIWHTVPGVEPEEDEEVLFEA